MSWFLDSVSAHGAVNMGCSFSGHRATDMPIQQEDLDGMRMLNSVNVRCVCKRGRAGILSDPVSNDPRRRGAIVTCSCGTTVHMHHELSMFILFLWVLLRVNAASAVGVHIGNIPLPCRPVKQAGQEQPEATSPCTPGSGAAIKAVIPRNVRPCSCCALAAPHHVVDRPSGIALHRG